MVFVPSQQSHIEKESGQRHKNHEHCTDVAPTFISASVIVSVHDY